MKHFIKTVFFPVFILMFVHFFAFGQSSDNDITFFVGSDIHYFGENNEGRVSAQLTIEDMNTLPGKAYPAAIGGTVTSPGFVVFCGDIVNDARLDQFAEFEEDMGLKGENLLNYPVYEGLGNHDVTADNLDVWNFVKDRNLQRDHIVEISENGYHYGWEVSGVHFIQLNLYPGNEGDDDNFNNTWNKPMFSLEFLEQYLDKHVGLSGAPVFLFQHYGWDNFSMHAWGNGGWWSEAEREAYYDVIKDYNIVGIFWGHSHAFNFMQWNGIDVFNDASMSRDQSKAGRYMVVNISGDQMSVAARDADGTGKWEQTKVKTISRPDPEGITFFATSDIHYGQTNATEYAAANIDSMNILPGQDYPEAIGGKVGIPRGVIIPGDFTKDDTEAEVAAYAANWGVNKEGRLNYPIFDTWGNHDGNRSRQLIKDRNLQRAIDVNVSENGLHYSFDWENVHFISAGIFPGNGKSDGLFNYDPFNSLDFLTADLRTNVGNTGEPVLIYHHFGFGPHSLPPDKWWTLEEADAYYEVIKDYNIIAIVHGHEHDHSFSKWNDIDIINLPHWDEEKGVGFCAVNIRGTELNAAMYNIKTGWMETFSKSITLGSVNWNIRPKVSITVPENMEYFIEYGDLEIIAEASDEDGTVESVEFFVDGTSIGISTTPPYSVNWTMDKNGYFKIHAVATDDVGGFMKSDAVTIAVGEDINIAPLATSLTTSYVAPWETLEAIRDNKDPKSSKDLSNKAYGNWNGPTNFNKWNWVQYDFPWEVTLGSSEVYWWDDGGQTTAAHNTYLEYWDIENARWEECPNPIINGEQISNDSYGLDRSATLKNPSPGCLKNRYNVTYFGEKITTTKVRLNFISTKAQGLLEWKIFKAGKNFAVPEHVNQDKLLIYPNPSNDLFYIQNEESGRSELSVFDATGKIVFLTYIYGNYTLDANQLPYKGTYLIRLVNKKSALYSKIARY